MGKIADAAFGARPATSTASPCARPTRVAKTISGSSNISRQEAFRVAT